MSNVVVDKNINIELHKDGDQFYEIYVNGLYLCNVVRKNISAEAKAVLGLKPTTQSDEDYAKECEESDAEDKNCEHQISSRRES